MSKPKKTTLCKNCLVMRDNPGRFELPNAVHPVTREPDLFDIHGHALCSECGAKWHRGHKGMRLVEFDSAGK
jgi:hypothetical protein